MVKRHLRRKRLFSSKRSFRQKEWFFEDCPKKFSRSPKTFQSMSESEESIWDFQMKVFSHKCSTEKVKFSYGMLAKKFDQNSTTFCSRFENVRNYFHTEFFLTHGFLWLSNVQFSKFGRKVFGIEFFADCQKMKTRVLFQKKLLGILLWTLRMQNRQNCSGFCQKIETFPFSGRKWLKELTFSDYNISPNRHSWHVKSVLKPRHLVSAKGRSISSPCPTLKRKINFITISFIQMLHWT